MVIVKPRAEDGVTREAKWILDVFRKGKLGRGGVLHLREFGHALVWEAGFVSDQAVREALAYLFAEGFLRQHHTAFELTEKGWAYVSGLTPPKG